MSIVLSKHRAASTLQAASKEEAGGFPRGEGRGQGLPETCLDGGSKGGSAEKAAVLGVGMLNECLEGRQEGSASQTSFLGQRHAQQQ